MRIVDLINKKKHGLELSKDEIYFIVNTYVEGKTPDYQISALLMAILLKGMKPSETANLTMAMMHSGETIDLKDIKGIKVDKHSTGGVGDKTTLVVAPIVASLGAPVAKMSGRGLGHTGGTIDKLESIKGFKTSLTIKEFKKQINKIGVSVIAQTKNIVPADKKMYALRDVTGTVDSMPLIAASIMSKKLATGSDAILLDVKCGNGAFMKDLSSAKELANEMINIGKELNRDVRVEITNMSRPLGKAIGNKNEVLEAIDTLKGKGPSDFVEVVVSASEEMLMQAKIFETRKEANAAILTCINDGRALTKFYELVQAQGGDVKDLESKTFWKPKFKFEIKALESGYMNILSAIEFGIAAMKLGAGRITKDQEIDMEAGINLNKKTNDKVAIGDTIITLYSSNKIDSLIAKELKSAYKIVNKKVKNNIILKKIS